jgi:hypothetical protein
MGGCGVCVPDSVTGVLLMRVLPHVLHALAAVAQREPWRAF